MVLYVDFTLCQQAFIAVIMSTVVFVSNAIIFLESSTTVPAAGALISPASTYDSIELFGIGTIPTTELSMGI
jgi:hypothetical protein